MQHDGSSARGKEQSVSPWGQLNLHRACRCVWCVERGSTWAAHWRPAAADGPSQHSAATACVSAEVTPPLCFLLLTLTSLPLSLTGDPAHRYCFPLPGQRWRPNQTRLMPLKRSGRNVGTKGRREPGRKWRNLSGFIVLFILHAVQSLLLIQEQREPLEQEPSHLGQTMWRGVRDGTLPRWLDFFVCMKSAGRKWIERGQRPSGTDGDWMNPRSHLNAHFLPLDFSDCT